MRHASPPRCRGAALLIVLVVLLTGATAMLVHALGRKQLAAERDRRTYEALVLAHDALLAYAATNASHPGRLPCPDLDGNGQDNDTCGHVATRVGRLPWRALGIEPLQDGAGELLWYAVSRCALKRSPDSYCGQYLLNSNTAGQLQTDGLGIDDAMAIVFAPGAPFTGQQRTSDPQASAFQAAQHYLEGENALAPPQVYKDMQLGRDRFEARLRCETSDCPDGPFNDQLLPLRTERYHEAVAAAVQARLEREVRPLLEKHYALWGAYPYAAPFDGRETDSKPLPPVPGMPPLLFGLLPHNLGPDTEGWADCVAEYETHQAQLEAVTADWHAEDACRIHFQLAPDSAGSGHVRFELLTRTGPSGTGWIGRGFFEAPEVLLNPSSLSYTVRLAVLANAQGRVEIEVQALPCHDPTACSAAFTQPIQLTAYPPRRLTALNASDGPLKWLYDNEWPRVLAYQVASGSAPGASDEIWLRVRNGQDNESALARAALILAGAPLQPQDLVTRRAAPLACAPAPGGAHYPAPTYLAAFFEGHNRKPCDPTDPAFATLSAGSASVSFNDRLVLLSAEPIH